MVVSNALHPVIRIPPLFNTHWHGRGGPWSLDLLDLAVDGGACVLGPMPNDNGGLRTAQQVRANLERLSKAQKALFVRFLPYVLINEETTQADIDACIKAGIYDGKIYPLDRTTKSDELGVRWYHLLIPIVKHCGRVGMKVHLHPEHPWLDVPGRSAEFMFLSIVDMFLGATQEEGTIFVWEHGTDASCIPQWKVMAETGRLFLTLTAHHPATHEDEVFGDVRATCKPPIKAIQDRDGLRNLIAQDHPWVMAGLDDAAHPLEAKHVHQGRCACGAFTTPFGIKLYAHTLDDLLQQHGENGVQTFRNFIYWNAAWLHGFGDPPYELELVRDPENPFVIPESYTVGDKVVESFGAGRELIYRLRRVVS